MAQQLEAAADQESAVVERKSAVVDGLTARQLEAKLDIMYNKVIIFIWMSLTNLHYIHLRFCEAVPLTWF